MKTFNSETPFNLHVVRFLEVLPHLTQHTFPRIPRVNQHVVQPLLLLIILRHVCLDLLLFKSRRYFIVLEHSRF